MASTSSNQDSTKRKRSVETSHPNSNVTVQAIFDKNHAGRHDTEKKLIALYNNRIKRLEAQNIKDEATIQEHQKKLETIILEHQKKVDRRNQQIEEIREQIVGVYKSIEDTLYIS